MTESKVVTNRSNGGCRWFRGQLHAHTYWSDGSGFPEQAIAAHKRLGYDFLCLTDHNRFADDQMAWRKVEDEAGIRSPRIFREIFKAYADDFGADWVETRFDGDDEFVRLKTYAELKARFEEPDRFLLMPGCEITQKIGDSSVHMNHINLPGMLPSIRGANYVMKVDTSKTISELIAFNELEARQLAAASGTPYLLILNHPFWQYYDVLPHNLIDNHAIGFFEVYPNSSEYAPYPMASDYTVEKFWDIVNAFRVARGHPLLYGVGADDSHYYAPPRINGKAGVGGAWVMVRAASLTPKHLIAAMHAGDFHVTVGVLLEDIAFTPADKTLRVLARAEPGVNYTIKFITTKRGFDRTMSAIDCPAEGKRPARAIPVYSSDIGRIVKTVTGPVAEYQMADDDLYVRARVESDLPCKHQRPFHPVTATAWTQPYRLPDR